MKNSLGCAAVLRCVGAACCGLTMISSARAETDVGAVEAAAPVIAAQAAYVLQPAPAPAKAAPADPDSFFKGWKGSIEGGINGSTGNSENFNVRAGLGAKRTTSAMETSAALTYTWATSEGKKTKSRFEADMRNDWNLGESRWFLFGQAKYEFDEFQNWKHRVSASIGPGYWVIKEDKTTLKVRGGVGFSKEFASSHNEIIPEAMLGADLTHKFTERSQVFLTGEWYPSLKNFPQFRSIVKTGYQVLVDPEINMSFKVGAEWRHQSKVTGNIKKNDVDYFLLLVWDL